LNNYFLDTKELEAIGREALQSASKALSKILGYNVRIKLASAFMLSPINLMEVLGRESIFDVAVAYSKLKGMLSGIILLAIPLNDAAETLKNMILRTLGVSMLNEEIATDLFKEIANIFFGAIATSLYNKYKIIVSYSVPKVVIDNFMAILDNIVTLYIMEFDELVIYDAEIVGENTPRIKILIIPEEGRKFSRSELVAGDFR